MPGNNIEAPGDWGNEEFGSPIPVESSIVYKGTSGETLKTVKKIWTPLNQLTAECTTVGNNTAGVFYEYSGSTMLITDEAEYDYGLVSSSCQRPSGAPTRETATTYQSFGTTAVLPVSSSILDRPCSVIVYGNGAKVGETDYFYDSAPIGSACGAAGTPSVARVSPTAINHDETNYSPTSSSSPRGNLTAVIRRCLQGCSDSSTQYSYDETGQVASMTDPNGNLTTYSFADSFAAGDGTAPGNTNTYLTKISRPKTSGVSHTQTFSYGYADGKMRSSTDVENNTTTSYCYITGGCKGTTNDPWARLTEIDSPDGGSTVQSYSDAGPNPYTITTTKLNSTESIIKYSISDAYGHLIQTQTSEPNGADVVNFVYDGLGRVYTATNPFLSPSQPSHSLVSSPSGTSLTTHYYDALDREIETVEQDGNALQWCYNGISSLSGVYCSPAHLGSMTNGTWVDSTDENGNHWQRTSDSLGRLTEVMEPNGTSQTSSMETDYSYDALNDLTSVKQCGALCTSPAPNGPISRSFYYDGLSRLIQAFNPETGWLCYGTLSGGSVPNGSNCNEGYDANGNLTAKTDGRGYVNNYSYDALNRKTLETSTAPNTYSHYFYYDQASLFGTTFVNPIGHLTLTTTSLTVGSSSFVGSASIFSNYDAMGRLRGIQECTPATCNSSNIADSNWYSLSGTYDLAGNLTSYTDGFQTTITSSYDDAGRLSSVSSNQNGGTTLWTANSYSPIGLTKATFGNGIAVDTLTYDPRERLQSASIVNSSNSLIYSEGLSYYPNSNVNTANDSVNGNWTYVYDTLNRLSTASTSNTGQNCAFGYDPFGNFKSEVPGGSGSCFSRSFTFSTATNHIDGYCYDAAGNVVDAGPCPQSGSKHQNFYDGWGHLLSANFNLSPATSYTVDSLDHRVSKFTGSSLAHQYLYGVDGNPVAEMDGSGNWLQTNIRAGGRFLAEMLPSGIAYLFQDHLGTIRAETGAMTGTCTSLPFGDALNCSGNTDPSGYHYTGKERDAESGNDYFGARYYASSMGRYMSPDWSAKVTPVPYAKLSSPQSLNLYSYVGNNPLRSVDADGHTDIAAECKGKTSCSKSVTDTVNIVHYVKKTKQSVVDSTLKVTTNFNLTTDSKGNVTVSASSTVEQVSGAVKYSDSQLATMGKDIGAIQQSAVMMGFGANTTQMMTAVGAAETAFGAANPTSSNPFKAPDINPLQLSGGKENGDLMYNIQGALDVFDFFGNKVDFDPIPTYRRFSDGSVPTMSNFGAVYNSVQETQP